MAPSSQIIYENFKLVGLKWIGDAPPKRQ